MELYLAAGVEDTWVKIGVGLLGVIAAIAAYMGQQSIRQGLLLLRAVPGHRLASHVGEAVAVSGHAERRDATPDGAQSQLLYKRTSYQERERTSFSWSRSSWRTVSVDKECHPFTLTVGGVEIDVQNEATEVHGTQNHGTHHAGGGWVSGLLGGGQGSRSSISELHGKQQITVVGKLLSDSEKRFMLVKDAGLGMLLSSYAGRAQGYRELIKGAIGVLLPVAWLIGSWNVWTG